jgi:hypothetical protein
MFNKAIDLFNPENGSSEFKVPGSRLLLLKYLRKNRYSAEISR